MTERRANFIGGEWIEGSDWSENRSPSDVSDLIGQFAQGTARNVDDAVQAARAALPVWSRAHQDRGDLLDRVGDRLMARKDELGELLSREEGKTLAEGKGEVERAARVFKFFAGEALRGGGDLINGARPTVAVEARREPVGVVGLITPWNFPIAIPAWKAAPALAYGNTVVMKPADLVPASAWALADIMRDCGAPAGVFNLVMGKGSVVGEALLNHPGVDAVSFTGSTGVGGRVAEACARGLKRFQLEMGGKNPLVVLADADLDAAVEAAVNGAFFATGQRCTASSRIIVDKAIYAAFLEKAEARRAALVVGHALDAKTNIGPAVSSAQLNQDLDYVEIGKGEGARLIGGGERLSLGTEGFYIAPALFADVNNSMRIAREEIFGPVASVIPADNADHALDIANDTEFGLSAGVFTQSLKQAERFKRELQAGMVMVNLPTAGVDLNAPFGGTKGSSFGPREQGPYAREFYTKIKTTYTQA